MSTITQNAPKRRRDSKCANCRKRPGTIQWGDVMTVLHGGGQMWCEVCAVTAQLKHAEERAAVIPELKRRLAELRDSPTSPALSQGTTERREP